MMQLQSAVLLFLFALMSLSPLQLCAHSQCDQGVEFIADGSGLYDENCSQNLSSLLRNVTSHTIICLEHESYIIDEFILIQDVTNITLETEEDRFESVFIRCTRKDATIDTAGLAFVNVTDLSIRNVIIDGCGFTGEDISNTVGRLREILNIFYIIPSSVRISLLLGHCENVLMEQVSIVNTKGFGLVGINVVGTSELKNVSFYNNTNPGECNPAQNVFNPSPSELADYDSLGGAATFMYFDYLPTSQTQYHQGSQFSLNLQNCNFTLNSECSLVYLNLLRSPGRGDSSLVRSTGYVLGGSGALTLALVQLEYGVTVNIASSVFYDNAATFGSGSTIAMFMGTNNTHVIFNDCKFDKSAMAFFNDVRQPDNITHNPNSFDRSVTFSVLNSNFTHAVELYAGSTLLIYSNYYSEIVSNNINVYVDKCIFRENKATVGSAVAVYEYKINGFGRGMQVSIKDSHFVNNKVLASNHDTMIALSRSASTINVRNVNVTLYGNCSFVDNIGTGLKAESSVVGINGNVTFLRNTGINGGALSLVTYSYLIMNRNSSVYFIENVARIGGGAIYTNENGVSPNLIGGYVDCFLHFAYDNFIVCDNCSDLNSYDVYIKFLDNEAAYTGSMVSGSSLATCPWAQELRERDKFNRTVFEILAEEYTNVFHFDQPPINSTFIQSTAASLNISYEYYDGSRIIEVFPGQQFNLDIFARDDFDQTISNVITAFAATDDPASNGSSLRTLLGTTNFAVLENNHSTGVPVTILGSQNQNISLVIYSTDPSGRAQLQLNITILECGFGFVFYPSNGSCACDPRLLNTEDGVFCDSVNHAFTVEDGAWIGPFRGEMIVDRCLLFGYCRAGPTQVFINSDDVTEINFDVQCEPELNRFGFLCSECKENFSAVLGTRNCRLCTNWYLFLLIFFIAIGIVAIMVIQYLNITITIGYINGAIFYSNIVSIYGHTIVPGDSYNEALVLISFPSLNLGIETCFYNGMTIFHRVLWQLSFPIYLFLLMVIITFLARTRCWKLNQWFQSRVLNQSAGPGIIRTFATLLIVCYVSVLGACSELIAFNRIFTIDDNPFLQWRSQPSIKYFGKEHCVPGILAFVILIFYIIPLPLFLLFPSTLYKNRYTSRFKPIYDAFWAPYKPQYRYFLGFRLIFRILPFFLAATVRPPLSLFITNFFLVLYLLVHCLLQPFQEKWRNYIDAAFVCNLVLILSGSIYFWSEYNSTDLEEKRDEVTLISLIYTNILIVLGFVLILGIALYHVVLKFPEKRKRIEQVLLKRIRKSLKTTDEDQMAEENDYTNGSHEEMIATNSDYQDQDQNRATENRLTQRPTQGLLPPVRAVELREPLLESGTLSLHQVDPSTSFVPRAVQDFIADLRQ